MHLHDLRRKRLILSLLLLICGVFALYPYLSKQPNDRIFKTVAHLDKDVRADVIKTLFLAEAIAEKGNSLTLTGEGGEALVSVLEKLGNGVSLLRDELTAMPSRSKQLTPAAEKAYKSLDALLTEFIISLAESGE